MSARHDHMDAHAPAAGPRPVGLGADSGLRLGSLAMTLGLDDIVEILLRRKYAIALTGLAFFGLALAALWILPRDYTAHTELTIDPRGLDAVDKEVTPRDGTSEGRATLVNTQMQVLVSDSVLALVAERENLDKDPEFVSQGGIMSGLKALVRSLTGGAADKGDARLVALNTLKQATGVMLTPSSFVVHLSVTTQEPEKSRRLVGAITRVFIEQQALTRQAATRKVSQGLDERLSELRERVANAEDAIEKYKTENNIVDAGGRLNNEQQLTELTNQLGLARIRSSEMRSRYEQIRKAAASGARSDDLPEAIRSQTITQLRSQYAQVRQRADSMAATHGPRHPDFIETNAQAQSLAREIGDEVQRIAASAKRDYEQAQATEKDLGSKLTALKSQSTGVNQSLVRLRELERDAKASRDIYENFLNRARATREQEMIDTSNIKVISPPLLPLKPNGPPAAIMLFIAAMAGLSLGAAMAVMADSLSGRVHSPRMLSARAGLSVITTLPLPRAGMTARAMLGHTRLGHTRLGRAQHRPRIEILANEMREDDATHALLRLYDALKQFARPGMPQVVLVTSADDLPGRAETAVNLAVTADLCGERVLLVDFDLREAGISRALGGPAAAGLDAVLAGRRPLSGALHGIAGTGVAILPNFRLDPSVLHAGPAMIEHGLLGQARGFDMIIIDGGKAGAAGVFASLASMASDIIVTVRAGEARLDALARARMALGANAGKVIGAAYLCAASARKKADWTDYAAWSPLAPDASINAHYTEQLRHQANH